MNINIGERIWQNSTKSLMSEYVRVIGRVIGKVFIKDLNKTISYNTVADILSSDAKNSKDLISAIQNKWVDIVYGKEFLNQKTYTTQLNSQDKSEMQLRQSQISVDELKKYVSDETKKAVSELGSSVAQILDEVKKLQNNNNVDLNQHLANEIVQQIVQKLPSGKISEKDVEKITENVFINIDEDRELKTNIKTGELGEVTKLKGKKAKSIASKLKNMRR